MWKQRIYKSLKEKEKTYQLHDHREKISMRRKIIVKKKKSMRRNSVETCEAHAYVRAIMF